MNQDEHYPTYMGMIWGQFKKKPFGMGALVVLSLFVIVGLYAPLFASSKPLAVVYEGKVYFPLLRYLFYTGFYTKRVDIFYNLLMFTLPIGIIGASLLNRWGKKAIRPFIYFLFFIQLLLFLVFSFGIIKNPAGVSKLSHQRQEELQKVIDFRQDPLLLPITTSSSWEFDLKYLSDYDKLSYLLRYRQRKKEHEELQPFAITYERETNKKMPTLFSMDQNNFQQELDRINATIKGSEGAALAAKERLGELTSAYLPFSLSMLLAKKELEAAQGELRSLEKIKAPEETLAKVKEKVIAAEALYGKILQDGSKERDALIAAKQSIKRWENARAKKAYLVDRERWLEEGQTRISFEIPALLRPFHWEDDAGGQQSINKYIPWWHLTRINRKDLLSAILFGVRISLVVGISSVLISLIIGIPLGMVSGYFAGKTDIIIFRFIEIWEAMPTFFMLLLVVAITQSKSIFLVVGILGIFGWTGFGRFIRGETLKQRGLPYVMACRSLGFSNRHIMFSHILPNAIPPILTLLPFSMMAAITSEAGLSFLGLGEEGSASWGVLMDEGRSVFPGESYLLWPPAILLTILLISIAIVGDALRDAIDPKMQR